MARRRTSGVVRSPDSGYKFVCQACENEVVQIGLPELVFEITVDRHGNTSSEALQCCEDCAVEIKESNAKVTKKKPQPTRQVRPLRDVAELPPDLQAARAELDKSRQSNEKIDKLCDAVAGLAAMMSQFMMTQTPLQPSLLPAPPLTIPTPIPTPKRKILMPPKPRAQSRTTKPKNKAKISTAAAKPRRTAG